MMPARKITVLCLGLMITSGGHSFARQMEQITYTGKVVNALGQPVQGAKVSLYEITYHNWALPHKVNIAGDVVTRVGGTFTFKAPAGSQIHRYATIIVRKQGLSLGWGNWDMDEDQHEQIVLGQPAEVSGLVVGANGKPIEGAAVTIAFGVAGTDENRRFINQYVAPALFTTRTDASGKFVIHDLPADATFEFLVTKPGRATVCTLDWSSFNVEQLGYRAGQSGIKIILPLEATITGFVVDGQSNEPVSDVQLILTQARNRLAWGQGIIRPKQDGTFSLKALAAGEYTLQLAAPEKQTADWVAEPVQIKLNPGQAKANVRIELSKGGLLEVVITEATSKRPVENASVSIRDGRNNRWLSARSDKNGIARVRLVRGGYQVSGVYKQGFTSDRYQEPITIEEGAIRRIARTLSVLPKVSGVVRNAAGKPVEGVKLKVLPGGREEVRSDTDGNFEAIWDPRGWMDEDTAFCIVARHEQRNLAAAVEIGEDTTTLAIELEPGVTLAGRVVDPNDKGIPGARVTVMLRVSNWGAPLTRRRAATDANGRFEIRAVPVEHEYSVDARAEGYGQEDVRVHADDAVDNHLNVGALSLPRASLSVSGQIVDTQGNPVPHAQIESGGEGQPRRSTQSDMQGNFTLEDLCEGTLYIRVDVERDEKRLSARVFIDAGATDIEIIVRQGRPVSYYIRTRTYEQIIRSSNKFIAGTAVDENGSPVAGVPVGVCCIKREREEGKFSWSYSSYSTLSDITDEQGRFAIELEEDAEYNLRFSPDNHAAIIAYDIPAGTKDLKVTLPQGGTVTGRLVQLQKGKKVPIPSVELRIEQTDRGAYTHLGFDRDRTTMTDSEGRFQFEHLRTKVRSDRYKPEYAARVWEISYGNTSKTIAFYDGPTIDDLELVVRPDLAHAPPLTGKALPGLDGIKIDAAADGARDKVMIVCFFDMNQRPSRHCLRQLGERAKELKAKGFFIMAIQAAKVSSDALNEWVKESNIPFPVGTVEGDLYEVQFTWRVRSLPWLILTDRRRIVRAEGLSLTELTEKIKESNDVDE